MWPFIRCNADNYWHQATDTVKGFYHVKGNNKNTSVYGSNCESCDLTLRPQSWCIRTLSDVTDLFPWILRFQKRGWTVTAQTFLDWDAKEGCNVRKRKQTQDAGMKRANESCCSCAGASSSLYFKHMCMSMSSHPVSVNAHIHSDRALN